MIDKNNILEGLKFGKSININEVNPNKFYKIVSDRYISFLLPLKNKEIFLQDFNDRKLIYRKYNLIIFFNNNLITNVYFYHDNKSGFISIDNKRDFKIFEIKYRDLFLLYKISTDKNIVNIKKNITLFFNIFKKCKMNIK